MRRSNRTELCDATRNRKQSRFETHLGSDATVRKLLGASREQLGKTVQVQQLCNSIKKIIKKENELPQATQTIGLLSISALKHILTDIKFADDLCGLTVTLPPMKTFFICI